MTAASRTDVPGDVACRHDRCRWSKHRPGERRCRGRVQPPCHQAHRQALSCITERARGAARHGQMFAAESEGESGDIEPTVLRCPLETAEVQVETVDVDEGAQGARRSLPWSPNKNNRPKAVFYPRIHWQPTSSGGRCADTILGVRAICNLLLRTVVRPVHAAPCRCRAFDCREAERWPCRPRPPGNRTRSSISAPPIFGPERPSFSREVSEWPLSALFVGCTGTGTPRRRRAARYRPRGLSVELDVRKPRASLQRHVGRARCGAQLTRPGMIRLF